MTDFQFETIWRLLTEILTILKEKEIKELKSLEARHEAGPR